MTTAKSFDSICIKPDGSVEVSSVEKQVAAEIAAKESTKDATKNDDAHMRAAVSVIRETGRAATGTLARRLNISASAAAKVVDELEKRNIIGPAKDGAAREILVDLDTTKIKFKDENPGSPQNQESRPGAKKGRWEWLLNSEFAFDTVVLRDRLPALFEIMGEIRKNVSIQHAKLIAETDPVIVSSLMHRIEALNGIQLKMEEIPDRAVVVRADNAQTARDENMEIERKIFNFLKDMGKAFNALMGGELVDVIQKHREVVVGVLKRKDYPLCEVMTADAKQRFGFVGYVADENNPFRKIDWSRDQIRMSVIFRNPSAKKGEDNKIRIPRELGLRYSNLNQLNDVVQKWIDDHYEPFNCFVNEYQARRFLDAHSEFVDGDGIMWVKRGGQTVVTAVDKPGVFGKPGTVLGIGKIIRTKNNASFTWWESNIAELPRNKFITAATENIIRCASEARIETR
jgi:ribosomal protein S25